MSRVYLHHKGQHWLPEEHQRPFTIPGWAVKIPIGGRLEITAKMLRRLSRPAEQTAESFATFIAGVYNANRTPDMLEVQVEDDAAQPPNQDIVSALPDADWDTPATATPLADMASIDTHDTPTQFIPADHAALAPVQTEEQA